MSSLLVLRTFFSISPVHPVMYIHFLTLIQYSHHHLTAIVGTLNAYNRPRPPAREIEIMHAVTRRGQHRQRT
jgi:hypothetical protein